MADKEQDRKDNEEVPAWFAAYADSMEKTHEKILGRLEGLEKAEKKEAKTNEAADKKDRKDFDKKEAEEARGDETAHEAAEKLEEVKKEEKKDRKDESEKEEVKAEEKADRKDEAKMDESKAEEEREERARKDAQMHVENQTMKAKIAEMEARLDKVYREPTYEERNALSAARSRADSVYQMVTGRPASEPMPGENAIAYRKRLADGLRKFSAKFKEERVDSLSGAAFDIVESQIYADAQEASKSPDILGPGQLRAITRMDRGREITEYQGDPQATWAPFMGFGQTVKLNKH